MSVMSYFYHWGVPVVDVLKIIPYREPSQIGKRRFVAKILHPFYILTSLIQGF
jgi:hypothetical protein